jgi:multiple sugar transport system substrate-binding protein
VTIQLLFGLGADVAYLFDPIVQRWQQAHPQGPKIEWATLGGANGVEKLQTLLAANTAPDIYQLDPSQAVGFSDRGQFLALDPYMKRDRYDLSDFIPTSYVQYDWKGKRYGMPRGMSNQGLYVNQTLFDRAGVAYPPVKADAAGWDFNAFLKAADRLTVRSGTDIMQYGTLVGRGLRGGWGQWVQTNGGELFSKDFTQCLMGEPKVVEALQFMQDLIYKYRVAPTPKEEADGGGAQKLFVQGGNVGMYIAPVSGLDAHRKAAFTWDLGVNPQGKGKRLTTGGGVGWQIVATTKYPEEAWAVFQHVIDPESMKAMSPTWYPPRKSTLAYLLTVDPDLPPKNRQVGADGQSLMVSDPIFPAFDQISKDLLTSELDALWNNQRSAAQVVESLVPRVNAALKAQR